MAFLIAVFLVWVPCGFFASAVSNGKGHDGFNWFLGGLFFGPMALIASTGLEDRKQRKYLRLLAEANGVILDKKAENNQNEDARNWNTL